MRGKRLVNVSIIVAFAAPPFLTTIAYVILAGPNSGFINVVLRNTFNISGDTGPLDIFTLWGFVFLSLPHAVALVYITIFPTLNNMDPALEEASRLSGGKALVTLLRISIPMMRPSILAGALLAFSVSLAEF